MKTFIAIIIIINSTLFVFSQTKKQGFTPCTLTNADSPTLRGFYLRQSKQELKGIPYFESEYENSRIHDDIGGRSRFGYVIVNSIDLFYRTPGVRTVPDNKYEDIDFYLHFLDGNLAYISVRYLDYEPDSLGTFLTQISETTNLPIGSWVIVDKNNAKMKCSGFDVSVWTGKITSRPDYLEYPTLTISDTFAQAELEKRERNFKKRQLEEAKERQRIKEQKELEEKRKKKIFKP